MLLRKLLHTPEEAASVLGISRSRVFILMQTGQLASCKIGRVRRVSEQALSEYVSSLGK